MRGVCLLVLSVVGVVSSIKHDYNGFDDSILFGINWPGANEALENLVDGEAKSQNKEIHLVTTSNKEKYECHLPELQTKESTSIEEYEGPSPIELLKPLFAQKICSYRLESYWSYEVCHGRYIRQYHEEREGKVVRIQEYFLGHWSAEKQAKLEEAARAQETSAAPRTTKVEGLVLPYVEMVMDDGTLCDLSNKPRVTRVHYVCYTHGKHEVYSFKETATCEYEIIILSPLLCEHPRFKSKEVGENIIDCIPIGDSPKKPKSLLKAEVDSLRFHHQTIRLSNDGETHLKFELHPLGEGDDPAEESAKAKQLAEKPLPTISDDSPVRAFLNGENCLNGGTGWWKYEFCYGQHVVQYHVHRNGEKTTLMLGRYDEQAHLDWIKDNKAKAPKPIGQRTSITHFYSNGDICDKTGKPRQTEVKLKCLENSSSSAQVSLYLLEPRTCHYILGVESPLICDILPYADENGLIKPNPVLGKREEVAELKTEEEAIPEKDDAKDILAVLKVEKIEKDGETHLKFELHPLGEGDDPAEESAKAKQLAEKPLPTISDDSPARAFLNGENCLNGGTGWWKYEFCYGQHVVQYHVHRNGEKTTLMLGRYDEQAHLDWIKDNKAKAPKPIGQRTSITHFYSNGDICDKAGKPRQTEVKLKCLENSSSSAQVSLYLLEPRTCHYILGVESPLICDILPYADKNGLIKPNPVSGKREEVAELKTEEEVIPEKDGETHLKFELHPLGEGDDPAEESAKAKQLAEKPLPTISDDSPVRAFLNGENCLNGGTGWWKYEFCYGQHVVQYHVHRNGEKITLMLGRYDEQAHLDWIKDNKAKAPKPIGQRTSITHFYSNGDICDKAGKPRQTEVKLKCLENSSSSAQVSLYLLEPRTCHYILGVESPLICDILPYADENGLIKPNPVLGKREEVAELKTEEEAIPEKVPKLGND